MRTVMLSLSCLSLILAGCSGYPAPKSTTPAPTPATATPTLSVAAGSYPAAQTITISDTTPGSTIYYTTDGTMPTVASTRYSGPITVSITETLMAAAIASGYTLSAVASASYTIAKPPPPAPSGTVFHGQVPIAGARVYLFAANTTGYGNASVSLLEPALTGASDEIGAYVVTGSDGRFAFTGEYHCTANTQVYVYVLGGDAGSGPIQPRGCLPCWAPAPLQAASPSLRR